MVITEEKNRFGFSFAFSVLLHLTLLVLFALFSDAGVKALTPEAKRFIVELFEQPPNKVGEGAPDEAKRLASQNRKVERETAPKKMPKKASPPPVSREKFDSPATAVEVKREDTEKRAEHVLQKGLEPARSAAVEKRAAAKTVPEEESLPGLSELLPTVEQLTQSVESVTSSDVTEGESVSLNTAEFKYVSYFSRLRDRIGMVWRYPEPAKIAGLQGKLVLRFVISSDGSLKSVKVLKSSGIPILDDEAVRAVVKAAPYHAIPPNLGKSLNIVANFEYELSDVYLR